MHQPPGAQIDLCAPDAAPELEPPSLASLQARFGESALRSPPLTPGSQAGRQSGPIYYPAAPGSIKRGPPPALQQPVAAEPDTSALPEYENVRSPFTAAKDAGGGRGVAAAFRFESGGGGGWDGAQGQGSSAKVTAVGVPLPGARPRASTSGGGGNFYETPPYRGSLQSSAMLQGPATAAVDSHQMNQL